MYGSILYELFLPHPPEKLWEVFTDPLALEQWKAPNDFEERIGHEFTFRLPVTDDHDASVGYCRVTELEKPFRLEYSWRGGPYPDTLVRYRFAPEGTGSRLYFEHSGFDLNDPDQKLVYEITRDGCEQKPYGWWGDLRDRNGTLLEPDPSKEGSVTVELKR